MSDIDSTEQWLADVFGPDPSAAPAAGDEATEQDEGGVDRGVANLDAPADGPASRNERTPNANAGAAKAAIVLVAASAVAMTAIVATLVGFGNFASPSPPPQPVAAATVVTPSGAPAAPPVGEDQAIPFTASANCPAGSTSAQALTDTGTDSAWVCVRGGVDGQVLHVEFGRAYVLNAVSVTPGWVAKTPGGKDEWLQHRVVTRVQYIFNDSERTIVTHDTGNTHGAVVLPLNKILASRVTVIVLHTSRPPAEPAPTESPSIVARPGFVDSMLGAGGAPLAPDATQTFEPVAPGEQGGGDPVDATFAISGLKFLGHQPN